MGAAILGGQVGARAENIHAGALAGRAGAGAVVAS
jgi:hypothetical protein